MKYAVTLTLLLALSASAHAQEQSFGLADMLSGVPGEVVQGIRPGESNPLPEEVLNTPARQSRPETSQVVMPTLAPAEAPVGEINWRAIREQAMQVSEVTAPESLGEDLEPAVGRDRLLAGLKRKRPDAPEKDLIPGKPAFSAAPISAAIGLSSPQPELYRHNPNVGRNSNVPAASGHGQDYAAPN